METNSNEERASPVQKIQKFFSSARRVLTIAHKPDNETFKTMLKISAIGILVIGAVGFVIQFVFAVLGLGR